MPGIRVSWTSWPGMAHVVEHGGVQHGCNGLDDRLLLVFADFDEDRHRVAVGVLQLKVRRHGVVVIGGDANPYRRFGDRNEVSLDSRSHAAPEAELVIRRHASRDIEAVSSTTRHPAYTWHVRLPLTVKERNETGS